jgi:uncharacterized protein YfbU (UPF0304 family)
MTDDKRAEVRDTLEMFDSLQFAYQRLPDKSGIDSSEIHFIGYDPNTPAEDEHREYATCYYNAHPEKFKTLKVVGEAPNAHFPEPHQQTLHTYRWMLEVWRPYRGSQLTKEQIQEIIRAKVNPDYR